ncbi:MAG: hypothetical protein KKA07_02515 [Bacteroidetes bacterium]|nr:hypothetical protein [Bacteroidota bacterium]MBU1717923.1 hypothetical protein [Bacteroidota bacterium]
MKKIALVLGTAFIAAIALSSCKKDYTCECSWSDAPTLKTTVTINNTKKKAEDLCTEMTWTFDGATYSCEII